MEEAHRKSSKGEVGGRRFLKRRSIPQLLESSPPLKRQKEVDSSSLPDGGKKSGNILANQEELKSLHSQVRMPDSGVGCPERNLNDLPEEVLLDILLKLPIKSLLDSTILVSKKWYNLTEASYSIATKRSAHNPCLLLFWISEKSFEISMLRDQETPLLSLDVSFIPNQNLKVHKIVGSSHGLVCFFIQTANENENNVMGDDIKLIIVWNPARDQFRYLPKRKPLKEEASKGRPWSCCPECPLLGFDFIPEISEYKVVRIFSTRTSSYSNDVTFRAQVFLQIRNSWKVVKDTLKFPSFGGCLTSQAVTANGVVYFLVQQMSPEEDRLVSFNLRDEVFRVITLPKELRTSGHHELIPWKGSVAMIITKFSPMNDFGQAVLWALMSTSSTTTTECTSISTTTTECTDHDQQDQECCCKQSRTWIPEITSRFPEVLSKESYRCIGFWKDQFLVCRGSSAEPVGTLAPEAENLFLYDPRSETKKKILNHGEMTVFYHGISHVETLVPV